MGPHPLPGGGTWRDLAPLPVTVGALIGTTWAPEGPWDPETVTIQAPLTLAPDLSRQEEPEAQGQVGGRGTTGLAGETQTQVQRLGGDLATLLPPSTPF